MSDSETINELRAMLEDHRQQYANKELELIAVRASLLNWAVDRWNAEVRGRPLVNVNRRPLDDTWRQVIRYAGGNDRELIGPTHDELL